MQRPEKTEYAPFYETYILMVQESEIIPAMQSQTELFANFALKITPDKENFAYAEGKWTVKEVFGHIIDAERVFAYRVLRFSRNDKTSLASFDENFYVENANFQHRTIADLTEEFLFLRQANLLMFNSLSVSDWERNGTASDSQISVRALAYIMVGHVRHHLKILSERYLN